MICGVADEGFMKNSEDDEGIERVCRRGGVGDGTDPRNSGIGYGRVWNIKI